MDKIEEKIIDVMQKNSDRGKTRLYLKDLAKQVGESQLNVKKGVKILIEAGKLDYWHSGSTTYIMLKSEFDKLKREESLYMN